MYEALSKLASATLVCGLLVIMKLVLNSGRLYPSSMGGDFAPSFSDRLWYAAPGLLVAAVSFLMYGVALLGIVVAWADFRATWMLAQIAFVAVALLFSFVINLAGDFFAIHPRIGQLIAPNAELIVYLLSLVPVALALVMARQRGGARAAVRAKADASLDITRSRL